MKNIDKMATVELVNRLGQIDKRIKEIERLKQMLKIEYNDIILELWERVPTLKDEEQFKRK